MKGLFKLTTAALALVTLASCSEDVLESKKIASGANTATVTIDDLSGYVVTRAGLAEDLAKTPTQVWEDGDKIRVYDENQDKNDVYEFTGSAFTLRGTSNLKSDPAKAIFPSDNILYGSWGADGNKAVIEIPDPIVYKEFTYNGSTCYSSNLPAWGTATKKTDGNGVNIDLHYLTAALKITLDNVLSFGSTSLTITAEDDLGNSKNLSGAFVATLNDNAKLEEGKGLEVSPFLNVDISAVSSEHAVIYVPIPAGKYGNITIIDDLGRNVIVYDKGFVAEVGHVYGKNFKKILDLSNQNVAAINTALVSSQANTDNVEINVPDGGAGSKFDVEDAVKMPKMACEVVTINIPANDVVTEDPANPVSKTLTIQNRSKIDSFDGTLVLNVGAVKATDLTTLDINLPGAKVVLEGNYTNITTITANVEDLVFGDGDDTQATTVDLSTGALTLSECVNLTVDSDASVTADVAPAAAKLTGKIAVEGTLTGDVTIAANGKTTAIEVAADGTLAGDVTINNGAATTLSVAADGTLTGDVSVTATATTSAITVNGTLTGDVTIANAATLRIGGAEGVVDGDITTKGDVTVANTAENEAITGTLTFNAAKTLTLTGGYIGTLAAGSQAITIANEEVIQTAIGSGTGTAIKAYTSKWAGKKVDATNFSTYAAATEVWTATQFQAMSTAASVAMKANINLDSKAFTPIAATVGFNGGGFKVSGLILNGSKATDKVGLFASVNADAIIQNFTLDGVSTNVTNAASVGAVAAEITSGTVDIKKVTVTGTGTFGSTAAISNVGGLVGQITGGTVTIGATSNPVSISLGAISGKANLGGVVGKIGAATAVTIAQTTVALTNPFSVVGVSSLSAEVSEPTAGTVGNYIGTINDPTTTPAAVVSITDYSAINKVAGNRAAYGYKYHWVKDASDRRCAFFGNNNALNGGAVGYSPAFASLTIGSKTYADDEKTVVKYDDINDLSGDFVNIFVFVDNWSDQ